MFAKNISAKNISVKNIFKKNSPKIFPKKILLPNIFPKKKVGAKPPSCPQGLCWYRAIERSQPSVRYFPLQQQHTTHYVVQATVSMDTTGLMAQTIITSDLTGLMMWPQSLAPQGSQWQVSPAASVAGTRPGLATWMSSSSSVFG